MTILFLLAATGCSETFPDFDAPSVESISIEPTSVELVTGPSGGPPVDFVVTGHYSDGQTLPLELVEWSVSNRSAGEIDEGGVFTPSTSAGGDSYVTARLDHMEARATVSVTYMESIVEEGADASAFSGDLWPMDDPWLYPTNGVNLPRNTPSILFQWQDLAAASYRLRFRSTSTDITVYTAANTWEAPEDLWARIVATNAGGSVTVELAAALDGVTYVAPTYTIQVNRLDARGSIIYWSTTKEGFIEIPYGDVARDFYTREQSGHCVACHVISSSGLFAFTYDGGNGPLGVNRMDDKAAVMAYESYAGGNFKTFSPDSRFLLSTFAGQLLLWNGVTMEFLGEVATPQPATHVDWSPDGNQVALVLVPEIVYDWSFVGGVIAVMDHLGNGTFGEPRVLVDFGDGTNLYYPAWSPDGEWIAFNRSTGDAVDDPDAEVWVVPSTGGTPIHLDNANAAGTLHNSWPRWGPLPDDDVLWLTFSSRRPYGLMTTGVYPQIWVAAFDPVRARRGEDPSWPAFWLPNQDMSTGNHIPQWPQ